MTSRRPPRLRELARLVAGKRDCPEGGRGRGEGAEEPVSTPRFVEDELRTGGRPGGATAERRDLPGRSPLCRNHPDSAPRLRVIGDELSIGRPGRLDALETVVGGAPFRSPGGEWENVQLVAAAERRVTTPSEPVTIASQRGPASIVDRSYGPPEHRNRRDPMHRSTRSRGRLLTVVPEAKVSSSFRGARG